MSLLLAIVGAAVRNLVLALVAGGMLMLVRPRDTTLRLRVWTLVLCGCLALPLLVATLPAWPMAWGVLPPAPVAAAPALRRAPIINLASLPPMPPPHRVVPESAVRSIAPTLALAVYGAGVFGLLLSLALGLIRSRRVRGRARQILTEFGPILESAEVSLPLCMGLYRPAIILPLGWREWEQERLQAVMAHETSHIMRQDPLTRCLAHVHRALFWFSPLAWWLPRQLSALAETASDGAALATGMAPANYAEWLLQLVRQGNARARLRATEVAMIGARRLEHRLEQILNWKGESMQISNHATRGLLAAAIPLTLLAAIAQPALTRRPQPPRASTAPPQSPSTTSTKATLVFRPHSPNSPLAAESTSFTYALVVQPSDLVPDKRDPCQFTSYDSWAYVAVGDRCPVPKAWVDSASFAVLVSPNSATFLEKGKLLGTTTDRRAYNLFAELDQNSAKQLYLDAAQRRIQDQLRMANQVEEAWEADQRRHGETLTQQASQLDRQAAAAALANSSTAESNASRAQLLSETQQLTSEAAQYAPGKDGTKSWFDIARADRLAATAALRQQDAELGQQLAALRLEASGLVRQAERALRQQASDLH